ncbi:MAG: AAA family ATPase [Ardenticatenaceae bacterium]|nr:AAA family ATPase [Ardenticatenaceae bacterium]
MFDALLQTKLYMPAAHPGWVKRPSLLAKLEPNRLTKLILISAPAGYGKTTLATAWLQQLQAADTAQVCWLSLDEDDSDPQQFFRYLAEAVRPLPGIQSHLPQLLQSNQTIPPKTLMKAFVQDVFPVSVPFIFVLDDYHAFDSADIDTALGTLLDLMPPQMTLLLTSRSDPGFPISRLRARGELVELRADDLRFTEAEAACFLQQTMGLALLPEHIAALESRTEGWIAGLQMAALSMQHRASDDLHDFVRSFTGSHRFIMDYLTDEVLSQMSPTVQAFLLQTAVLQHLCADLCAAVLPVSAQQAQQTLEQLETTNSFLISLDDERRWYRYHHLFADLLRQKLPAAEAQVIRHKAAAWAAANGLTADAIEYALAAEAWETAVPLLVEHGLTFLFQGQLTTLRRWLDAFPAAVLHQQPRLCINYAWVLVNQGQMDAVEPYLQAAETAAQGAPAVRSVTSLIRANIARTREDLPLMQAEAALVLQLTPPDYALSRCAALLQLGAAQMMGATGTTADELETAVHMLQQASLLARQSRNLNVAFLAGGYLGLLYLLRGDEPTATAVLQDTQAFAANQGLAQSPLLLYVHLGLAQLAFAADDLEAARQEIAQAQAHGRFVNELSGLCRSGMLLALVELMAGNYAEARAALEMVRETAVSLKNPDLPQQIQFLQNLLAQTEPPRAQLQVAQWLAVGTSLAYARAIAQPDALPPAQSLIDPLSERELEILALIIAGLKNKEIAAQLFISLNTVLYHTKNIYSKLGVSKRSLAIAKARELELI